MLRAPVIASQGGPSATAEWLVFDDGPTGGRTLHGLPRQSGGERKSHAEPDTLYLVAGPGLARAPGSGRPHLGLTLVLGRAPSLEDRTLEPLVTGGVLSLDLTIAPTGDELRQVSIETGLKVDPLFVRSASWTLSNEDTGETFAEAMVHGNGGSTAFSQTVPREIALAALAALRGGASQIAVNCDAEFRAAAAETVTSQRNMSAADTTTISMSTTQLGTLRRISLERSLNEIVRDAADEMPLDAVVSAVCPSAEGTLQPVPWRLEGPRQSRGPEQGAGFAAIGDSIAAIPAVLRTSLVGRVNAHALAASGISVRPHGRWNRWQVADLILHPPDSEEQNQNLPVIEAEATLWPDRIEPQRYWYAPEFAIRLPEPTMDASNAPFRFGFAVVGFGEGGKPALEADVKFTLHPDMAEATRAAWEALGRPRCDPVPTNGLSAVLILPFVDENGVATQTSVSATEVKAVGDGVEVIFSLTDRFARLAYGVLGTSGFQSSLARVEIAYCFPAYVPVDASKTRVMWGGKSAKVDARALRRPPLGIAAMAAHHSFEGHAALLAAQPNIAVALPVLLEPAIFVRPKNYGIRTQGRQQALDAFVPCSTFGALYVQKGDPAKAEADQPIGCRDAWTIGQIKLRLYEPLDVDLGIPDPPWLIYRSVQVPGRFLVLPKAYTITRYEPSDWRACRPALYLYSNVDAVHPEKTSCILTGTLRPALTPADRCGLLDALRRKVHAKPTLEWPTDLAVEPQFTWAIPGGATQISPSAVQTPEGFQVSLGAPVDQILTLKSLVETSGVTASVSFKLADGSSIQSTLAIDLARVDGPWEAGAVSVAIAGGKATLTNNTERAADVKELLVYQAGIGVATVAIERRLEPREVAVVDGIVAGGVEAFASYTLANTGGSLEEIRTFVEDLHTNVVFISAFDLAAEHLQKITVEGRVAGVAGAGTVELVPERASDEMSFVLPLTAYLGQPTLQYRTTALASDGNARTGPWRDWRLDLQGNVVELHSNQILEG